MDDFPSSQPNHDSITVLKTIKKSIERELKKTADSNNTNKEASYKIIQLKMKELLMLDVTVGDLRVTKIGKLVTKLQGQLPVHLSKEATALNDKWKTTLHSYREHFKRTLSAEQKCKSLPKKDSSTCTASQATSKVSLIKENRLYKDHDSLAPKTSIATSNSHTKTHKTLTTTLLSPGHDHHQQFHFLPKQSSVTTTASKIIKASSCVPSSSLILSGNLDPQFPKSEKGVFNSVSVPKIIRTPLASSYTSNVSRLTPTITTTSSKRTISDNKNTQPTTATTSTSTMATPTSATPIASKTFVQYSQPRSHSTINSVETNLVLQQDSTRYNQIVLHVNEDKQKMSSFASTLGRVLDKNMASVVSLQKDCVNMLESFHQIKDQLFSFETEMTNRYESITDIIQKYTAPNNTRLLATQGNQENITNDAHNKQGSDERFVKSTSNQKVIWETPRQAAPSNTKPNTSISPSEMEMIFEDQFEFEPDAQQTISNHHQLGRVKVNPSIAQSPKGIVCQHETAESSLKDNDKVGKNPEKTGNKNMRNSDFMNSNLTSNLNPQQASLNARMSAQPSSTSKATGEKDENFSQSTFVFSPRRSSADDESSSSSSSDQQNRKKLGKTNLVDSVLSSMSFHPKRKSSQSRTPLSSAPANKKPFSSTHLENNHDKITQRQSEFVQNLTCLQEKNQNTAITTLTSNDCHEKLPASTVGGSDDQIMTIPSTSDEDANSILSGNEDPTSSSATTSQQPRHVSGYVNTATPGVRIKEEPTDEEGEDINFKISAVNENALNLSSAFPGEDVFPEVDRKPQVNFTQDRQQCVFQIPALNENALNLSSATPGKKQKQSDQEASSSGDVFLTGDRKTQVNFTIDKQRAYRMGSDGFMAPFNSTIAPKTEVVEPSSRATIDGAILYTANTNTTASSLNNVNGITNNSNDTNTNADNNLDRNGVYIRGANNYHNASNNTLNTDADSNHNMDNNTNNNSEDFLTFSQQVHDMSDELEDEEKSFLLEDKTKKRSYWNSNCKRASGVNHAPFLAKSSHGRVVAAHPRPVGKEAMQRMLNKKKKDEVISEKIKVLLDDDDIWKDSEF